ncbi:hypothetical protein [Halalkalibacter alkalisediminis]|uniref:DUF4148 domain-containing protein n=1 Tax=Halalkalibacter alkalisediminis TaxID=935616 RepID=A0ABV6NJU2_9BACI|nr:hypothetical protein [Halalkalibacter alkalisediminis]
MKAIVLTALTVSLLVVGTGNALAMEPESQMGNEYGTFNFGQKLSMHEDMSVQEVKAMYEDHHGTLGAAPSNNFTKHDCMLEKK